MSALLVVGFSVLVWLMGFGIGFSEGRGREQVRQVQKRIDAERAAGVGGLSAEGGQG